MELYVEPGRVVEIGWAGDRVEVGARVRVFCSVLGCSPGYEARLRGKVPLS